MAAKEARSIKSAHRVLEILEYFDREHSSATVMDLSRTLDYPQSSTSELLRCLSQLGYLQYDRYRRSYSPTARVALLGSWVAPRLFRGGTVLSALDDVAERTGQTVVLSTAANYVVQHVHVIDGRNDDAVVEHAGGTAPLLHSPQGRLILSSYQDAHIRPALHRLNAEEPDPARRGRVSDQLEQLLELRRYGWLIAPEAGPEGIGAVVVLLPTRRGAERLAMSVLAPSEVIEARGEEILATMVEARDAIRPAAAREADPHQTPAAIVRVPAFRSLDTVVPQPIHA